VIVTNGADTAIYDANSGTSWSGGDNAAEAAARLLANATKIAAADMRWAIEALMGRETGVWPRIVRARTAALIADMTDERGATRRPYARDMTFPRAATREAIKALKTGPTFTLIEGAPMVGKTNILRELATCTADSDDLSVLMLRGSGPGLFRALANLFASELEWNLKDSDARHWLRRMSNGSTGPILVIALDAVDPGTAMAADLEELASMRPGAKLKVILTTDQPAGLIATGSGRGDSALGTQVTRIEVGPLGLQEFRAAQAVLGQARISFARGAEYTDDYRAPWVLRTLYDQWTRRPSFRDPEKAVRWPASLGLQLVVAARSTFDGPHHLQRGYRLLARDQLADLTASSADMALAASNGFVVRQDALSAESREVLPELRKEGWVRTYRYNSRDDVVVPTLPAVYMAELADAAGDELGLRAATDAVAAGTWLGHRLDAVYLGDLVGAEAIRRHAGQRNGFSAGIIEGLLSIEPQEKLVEDLQFTMAAADGKPIHLKIEKGKAWLTNSSGDARGEAIDLGAERSRMYANVTPWMILGQFAHLRTAIADGAGQRVDAGVLLRIGQCPFPLLRANETGLGHLEHELEGIGTVLCGTQGPIEATTQAMVALLSDPTWDDAEDWVRAALATGSVPLANRVMIALGAVRESRIPRRSAWARRMLRDVVGPYVKFAIADARDRSRRTDGG
jgi:hypothetical protein